MAYKTHFKSDEPKQLTACNLVAPGTPPEAVNLTTDWKKVSCRGCRRTGQWFAAKQANGGG